MEQSSGGHNAPIGAWIACAIITAGFIVGGVALVFWNWPAFWVGVGLAAIGVIVARAVNIMDAVSEYGAPETHGSGGDPQGAQPI